MVATESVIAPFSRVSCEAVRASVESVAAGVSVAVSGVQAAGRKKDEG